MPLYLIKNTEKIYVDNNYNNLFIENIYVIDLFFIKSLHIQLIC